MSDQLADFLTPLLEMAAIIVIPLGMVWFIFWVLGSISRMRR